MAAAVIESLVLVALFAAGTTLVVRALPVIRGEVFRGVKPWACDLCMSWWCACIGQFIVLNVGEVRPTLMNALLLVSAAVPLSMLVLHFVGQPAGDFNLPPDDGDVK